MGKEDIEKMALYTREKALLPMMKKVYTPVESLETYLLESGQTVQKLMIFFKDMGERKKALEDMKVKFSNLAVSSSVVNNIEVNASGANKGAALKFLREYLKIEQKETAAFGDGSNDITMLLEAGIGFAMGNACPEAKEAADKITLSNEEEGVAFEIEHILQEA